MGQHLKGVVLLAARESFDLGHITRREKRGHLFRESDHIGGQEHCTEGACGVARTLRGKTAVVADDLNSVTRLTVEGERERE